MSNVGSAATAIGLKAKDFIVLAAERRVAYGSFIMSRAGKKVFTFKDRYGIAFAGLFADIQTLKRIMDVELHAYEIENGVKLSVRSAAKLLSVILYQYKWFPFLSEVIFGGVDEEGSHLIVMDALGSMIEDDYAAVGSGGPIAIAVLENGYREGLSREEAVELAVNAIKSAIKRDVYSGDGIDVAIIDHSGTEERFVKL